MKKLRYIGDYSDPLMLVTGRVYDAVGENATCYAVVDETGEIYLYTKESFVVVE